MAKIEKRDGTYLVSFPDFSHIHTFGDTLAEAKRHAADALSGALSADFERGFSIPKPGDYVGRSLYPIELSPHIEVAYLLRRMRRGVSQKEIADRLGISYQAYQRLENPRSANPTLKTLEKISTALGKRLEIRLA